MYCTLDCSPAEGELYPEVLDSAGEDPLLLCLDPADCSLADRPTRTGLLGAGTLQISLFHQC